MKRRSTTPAGGNYQDDDTLKAIEDDELPGTSIKGTVGYTNPIDSDGLGQRDTVTTDLTHNPVRQEPVQNRGMGGHLYSGVEGPDAETLDGGRNIVKQENTRLAKVNDYVELFHKEASDSQLYYRGYMDATEHKTLDEDLALLSKDYYNGYEQAKFYNKTPQQSSGQMLYDIKPNSNNLPRSGDLMPGDVDRGPNELTDGFNRATASALPLDVVTKFFEV